MDRFLRASCVLVVLLAVACEAQAQKTLPCPATWFFGDYYHAPPATPELRRQFARVLLSPLRELDAAVPEPSPAEREWLERELRQTGLRNIQAFDSIVNRKVMARDFVSATLPLLIELSSSNKLPLRKEVTAWALVAQHYDEIEYSRSIASLAEARVIDEKFLPVSEDAASTLAFICAAQARQIMYVVVVPYLQGRLNK